MWTLEVHGGLRYKGRSMFPSPVRFTIPRPGFSVSRFLVTACHETGPSLCPRVNEMVAGRRRRNDRPSPHHQPQPQPRSPRSHVARSPTASLQKIPDVQAHDRLNLPFAGLSPEHSPRRPVLWGCLRRTALFFRLLMSAVHTPIPSPKEATGQQGGSEPRTWDWNRMRFPGVVDVTPYPGLWTRGSCQTMPCGWWQGIELA